CDYVLHVASPFPTSIPKHEDELIVPAREGAIRVLRAARDAGVKRVVMTSSFAAIGYGHKPQEKPFTEIDWTDVDGGDVLPYAKGERLLAVASGFRAVRDIGGVLKRRMGDAAKRVPTLQLPNWLVRLAAMRDPAVQQILPELGKRKNATSEKAQRLLGWSPRS